MRSHKTLIVAVLLILALALPVQMQDDALQIWVTGGENDATTLQAAAAAFTEETGIEVQYQTGEDGPLIARLAAERDATFADVLYTVDAGNLSVNSHASVRYSTPFGGYKQSGLGRELGPDAAAAFSETKNVFISTEDWSRYFLDPIRAENNGNWFGELA